MENGIRPSRKKIAWPHGNAKLDLFSTKLETTLDICLEYKIICGLFKRNDEETNA